MSDNNDKTAAVITAFAVGAVVGTAIGILFAPKAGKETREDLGEWLNDNMAKGREKLQKMGEEIKHRKEQLAQALHGKESA
ncbi:MAG: YtxH domain-containing protein [Elusimicrobiales bacterium]